mmetsp:Transcript_42768/g.115350  ORF Transcript_42768/g.115350 Transcript_42768/m.115350 type:complete len:252 (-) Transcript_42768:363-1118(-)
MPPRCPGPSASEEELQHICLSPHHLRQVWAGLVDEAHCAGDKRIPHVQLPVGHGIFKVIIALVVVVLEVEQVALEGAALVLVLHIVDLVVHVRASVLDKPEEGARDLVAWDFFLDHPVKDLWRSVRHCDGVTSVIAEHVLDLRSVGYDRLAGHIGERQIPLGLEGLRRDARRDHVPCQHLAKEVLVLQLHGELEAPSHGHALRNALPPCLAHNMGEGLPLLTNEERLWRQRHGPLQLGLLRHAVRLAQRCL